MCGCACSFEEEIDEEDIFSRGCFWGLQKYMSVIQGVIETSVGYANGFVETRHMRRFAPVEPGTLRLLK